MRMRLRRASGFIVALGIATITVLSLQGLLPWQSPWAFFPDQPRLHYLAFLLGSTGLAFGWLRKPWLGGVGLSGICVNAWIVAPVLWDTGGDREGNPVLRVVHVNLGFQESLSVALVDFVQEQEAEVVFLQEVTPKLAEELKGWDGFRVVMAMPRTDSEGIAILVKRSMGPGVRVRRARLLHFEKEVSQRPYGELVLEIDAQKLRFLSFSTRRPGNRSDLATQERELAALGRWFEQGENVPSVAVGDFNATPWSRVMRQMLASSDLPPRQTGLSMAPTWPAWIGGVGIPIDLCVHGAGVQVSTIVGPDIGSDHYPICCEVLLH